VVATDEVIVSEDVTEDPRFTNNPLVLEKGIRFYAGAPLRTSTGLALGSLCVIDMEPRKFSDEERIRLQNMADDLMAELERTSAKANGNGDPAQVSEQRQKQDASA
jgi:GAF domain-containing protein